MRLAKFSDYAMRVVLYLAVHQDRRVPIGEIARAQDVSQSNLMKVVCTLVEGGILQSARGRLGGVRLARCPDDITVGEVVRLMEPQATLVDCSGCILGPSCDFLCILSEAREAFYASLSRHTIASVIARDSHAARLLRAAGERARTR